jgi:hypothetical protein
LASSTSVLLYSQKGDARADKATPQDIPTCEELLKRMEAEAEETIDGIARLKVEGSGVRAKL